MKDEIYPFVNPPLNFGYDALEPYIDEKTMCLHHSRHLQTYTDNLNAALRDRPQLQRMPLWKLTQGSLPDSVKQNAGGIYNHRFYFDGLCPCAAQRPSGALANAITRQFGSFFDFRKQFLDTALSVFGSGYAWLTARGNRLTIRKTANQEVPPFSERHILNLDVWEHAYYLKHYNMRADYINSWFCVVNWSKAERNFTHS